MAGTGGEMEQKSCAHYFIKYNSGHNFRMTTPNLHFYMDETNKRKHDDNVWLCPRMEISEENIR